MNKRFVCQEILRYGIGSVAIHTIESNLYDLIREIFAATWPNTTVEISLFHFENTTAVAGEVVLPVRHGHRDDTHGRGGKTEAR